MSAQMNTQPEPKGFPKFDNLEGIIKEREIHKQVIGIAQKRMQDIERTLAESVQAIQHVLSGGFSPPLSSDSDVQLVVVKLGNLMKAATPLPGSQIKALDTPPGNQALAAGATI